MKQRICYVSRNYRGVESAGNKAKTDNEVTLREMGATNLGLPTTYYNSKLLTFILDLAGIIRMMCCVRKGDTIVLQYPVKKYFSFICNVAHMRHAQVVALIHDLGSMRRKKLSIEKEISRLAHADSVIASNEVMAGWFRDHGYSHPLGVLGLFDYRSVAVSAPKESHSAPYTLVYAGGLSMRKNSFLLKMQDEIRHYSLDVYGNREGMPGLTDSPVLRVHDFMAAESFIERVPGDFGLVWDGDQINTCSGNFGEYLRLNSPHKVSFYLRAGLPIIVWRSSALASLVEQEGIGLCVESLTELNDLLNRITPQQLMAMRKAVNRVSEQLRTGYFFTRALRSVLAEE